MPRCPHYLFSRTDDAYWDVQKNPAIASDPRHAGDLRLNGYTPADLARAPDNEAADEPADNPTRDG